MMVAAEWKRRLAGQYGLRYQQYGILSAVSRFGFRSAFRRARCQGSAGRVLEKAAALVRKGQRLLCKPSREELNPLQGEDDAAIAEQNDLDRFREAAEEIEAARDAAEITSEDERVCEQQHRNSEFSTCSLASVSGNRKITPSTHQRSQLQKEH